MNDRSDGGAGVEEVVSEKASRPVTIAPACGSRGTRPARGFKAIAREWYQKYLIELVLRQKPLPPSKDGRRIPLRLHHQNPLIDERRGHAYISNTIRTSRYTVYDFFPKQIFFQFSRVGNFYFLCVGVPQTIPGLSTTGNYTTILPLLFFVLLTVAKEGYDDWKRHRLDKVENARSATVLRSVEDAETQRPWQRWLTSGSTAKRAAVEALDQGNGLGLRWCASEWKDLKVGDVIKLTRDEDVPADIVLLHADGENGVAYIETMALDGETNLKSKQVSAVLKDCSTAEAIASCHAEFVVEDPNPDLYRFDGKVTVNGKTLPLTLNEVVYRGCTLRNTSSAIGIVINTGEECKIRRNANRHPSAKKPALESIANKIVVTLAIYVVVLAVGCSIGYLMWRNAYERYAWYLAGLTVPFQEIIIGFAIQFNNVIPLALYVSLEIVKIGQMMMLNADIEMYDEASDTPARCNTNTILENLGQVGYIFCDKTGTLTENIMKFRKMSIAGTSWLHETDIAEEVDTHEEGKSGEGRGEDDSSILGPAPEQGDAAPRRLSQAVVGSPTTPIAAGVVRRSSSHWRSTGRPDHAQPNLNTRDLLEYINMCPSSAFSRRAVQYILAMSLCHTCLPEVKDGEIGFQAASPDELALVQAAQELGFLVVQRSSQTVTLRIANGRGQHEERAYDILDVIEFSSKRKRMSITVRCPDGRIWLITKGADSVILPRLRMAHLAMQKATEVRKSLDLEHELQRKSEAREPRNSFGGRPSLTIRRSIGRHSSAVAGTNKRSAPSGRKSFEAGKLRVSVSEGRPRPQALRTVSFDIPQEMTALSPTSSHLVPDKFRFLEDPSISDDAEIFARCFKHIDEFANEGLRTLLFAHKFLGEQDYNAWKKLYHDAETSLTDRQERIEAVGGIIEQSLDLIGASAIEDKLQRGVPETIDRLRRANIKVWMLTGDKRETAINIAHSARICRPGSDLYVLDVTKGDLEGQILGIIEDMQTPETGSLHAPSHTVVVIDGHTLAAIEEPDALNLRQLFYNLIPSVDSVICCRASPAQKALLVRTIRKAASKHSVTKPGLFPCSPASSAGPLTLAIGDGGNDLAMLSAAHVGVGISGREGLQAARVADYSIAQFRFLSRLLLVHGRWNYVRTARFILATFWKEMFFYLPTALYQRYNGYTGTSLYESWSLTVLNTLFTSLCVVVPGIWEQDLKAETLLAVPELYVFGQRDRGLNIPKYIAWMFGGAAEGVLVWFLCWALYGGLTPVRDDGLFALGNLVFSVAIMWINWKLMILDTHYKTGNVLLCFGITVSGWWAWQAFLAGIYSPGVWPYAVRGGFFDGFGQDPVWWLTLVAVFGLLVCIELAYRSIKRSLVVSGLWKWGWKWLSWSTWRKAFGPSSSGLTWWSGDGTKTSSLEDWDVELWQTMEQDPAIKETLRQMSRLGHEEEVVADNVDDATEEKTASA